MNTTLTSSQIVVLDLLQTVRQLHPPCEIDIVNDVIAQRLKDYPFASEVKTKIVDGEVYIIEADSKIESIVGYTPDELKDKPLSMIMFKAIPEEKLSKILESLDKYGVSVKTNHNKHKDGSLVETFGWIFKVAENDYREVVMCADKVVGYGV